MEREAERIRRFLRGGPAVRLPAARPGWVLLEAAGRGTVAVPAAVLQGMLDRGEVVADGKAARLGVAMPEKAAADALAPPPRDVGIGDKGKSAAEAVLVNHAESPLAALRRRKAKNGAPFLSAAEFDAGERLRADFERGHLMPRLGANWIAPVASGRRGGRSGITDLTDAALAARLRVEKALLAVGPELSGVLVDVCCFLKGLEQVESERGWPVRSAKIMVKSALGVLARHYDPGAARRGSLVHWGTADFRPKI